MRFAYLAFFHDDRQTNLAIAREDVDAARRVIVTTPGLALANIYLPEVATDMFNKDGPPPVFGFQLYFDELADMEAALAPSGHLQALTAPGVLSSIAGSRPTQQAMCVRPFPVDDAAVKTSGLPCSYLVHYPGPAEDMNAWLYHYVTHHPQLMRGFPGTRHIEVLSRLDWCGSLPWPRVDYMQRNRVMFDSPAALTHALQSPARLEMRADYKTFPPFSGGSRHFPMSTEAVHSLPRATAN
ncbi:hypothetical protein [Mesorhizobium sp.]|uniref:hypothetical protein n=1 Tax=Mesorhizobium sp. TaxID=1871066 RepID=UPI000FE4B280|nr:hypothetical protein [Mesorhizobium sp.]RWP51271.1 MAG: hypothetical protein EOR05_05035 [Mesorhizobium sp.]